MVKAYLRYELTETFGVVASNSNITYDTTGKQVFTACLESLAVWDVKQGSQVAFDRLGGSLLLVGIA